MMTREEKTTVMNVADDRIVHYSLPPEEAVIAAYEQFERGNWELDDHPSPEKHPAFKVHRRGVACGDWIAYV